MTPVHLPPGALAIKGSSGRLRSHRNAGDHPPPLSRSRRVHFLRVEAETEGGEPKRGGGWVVVHDGNEVIGKGWESARVLRLTPRHALRLAVELLRAACQATLKTDPLATPKTDPRRNGVCSFTTTIPWSMPTATPGGGSGPPHPPESWPSAASGESSWTAGTPNDVSRHWQE